MFATEGLDLELGNNAHLFAGNAIAKHLLSTSESEWVQWEETQFRPLVLYWIANPTEGMGARLTIAALGGTWSDCIHLSFL